MNKVDFARRLATRLQISNYESINYLNAFINELESALSEGEPISFQQFGTFAPWYQPARPGRNPQNGDPHPIPARTSVKFKAGKGLLEKMNGHLLGFLAALLLTLCGSSCTAELPTADANDEWLPIEINPGVVGMTIASSDTRAETVTLPTIVKTAFENGDEIKLTIKDATEATTKETVTLVYDNNTWKEKGTPNKDFKRKKDYIDCKVTAEYGTAIAENQTIDSQGKNVSTADYLKTTTAGTLEEDNKALKCTLSFEHQYPCITIQTNGKSINTATFSSSEHNVVVPVANASSVFANLQSSSYNQISLMFQGEAISTNITFDSPITFDKNKYYLFNIYTPATN